MTDLLTLLPDFDVGSFAHILPSLERTLISTADLLSLSPADVAKRATVPSVEVVKLCHAIVTTLHKDITVQNGQDVLLATSSCLSLLDDGLDALLNGGLAQSTMVEFVGESAVGKTQFLLTLLLSVQLPPPRGLNKSALYISTESPLKTQRLLQILTHHSKLSSLSPSDRPTLQRVHSIHVHDLEAQEHILRYQVPVAIKRHDIGLVIIDSIAANYRPEFGRTNNTSGPRRSAGSFARRSNQLTQIGTLLRDLATESGLVIVVANQVADRFAGGDAYAHAHTNANIVNSGPLTQTSYSASPMPAPPRSTQPPQRDPDLLVPCTLSTDDPLSLDHQQRFFTGWGDDSVSSSNLKTPSLGLTWANQLSARIALIKEPVYEDRVYEPGEDRNVVGWKREMKVVTSTWCGEGKGRFEIGMDGVKSVLDGHDLA